MTTTEVIDILTRHNQWRRGEDETIEQLHPKEIGIAIEWAIAVMEAAVLVYRDYPVLHNTHRIQLALNQKP